MKLRNSFVGISTWTHRCATFHSFVVELQISSGTFIRRRQSSSFYGRPLGPAPDHVLINRADKERALQWNFNSCLSQTLKKTTNVPPYQ